MKVKKAIVMLPTEDKTSNLLLCIKSYCDEEFEDDQDIEEDEEQQDTKGNISMGIGAYASTEYYTKQHLYILSDDEIQNGDWVMLNYPKGLETKKMIDGVDFENALCIKSENKLHNCGHKKIIATTDFSLEHRDASGNWKPLPQISKSDIKMYCKLGMSEVNVEYEIISDIVKIDSNEDFSHRNKNDERNWYWSIKDNLKLKVTSNNEVILCQAKDSWNREELDSIVYRAVNEFIYRAEKKNSFTFRGKDLIIWINENL